MAHVQLLGEKEKSHLALRWSLFTTHYYYYLPWDTAIHCKHLVLYLT